MKALLVALNAQYKHTNLAVRLLRAAAPEAEVYEGHINMPFTRLLDEIAAREAGFYGFSCYIWNIELVGKLCRALRKARPGARIFLGGPEVAHRAETLLRARPEIDCVLTGEGEVSLPLLLDGCAEAEIPGLVYRKNGEIAANPPAPPLPASAWPDAYREGVAGLEDRLVYIETSRGCPFQCGFCLSSLEETVRALPVEVAVQRLTALAEGGVKIIKLVDRTFNFDKKRANAIWRALIAHSARTGLCPTYHFELAAQLLDEEAISILTGAPKGLFQCEIGIQSTDDDTLEAVGRRAPFAAIREPIARLAAHEGLHVHVDLIAGLPREDMTRFAKSFDDAYALGAEALQLGFLKLLPGSALRRDAQKHGLVYMDDPPYTVLGTKDMTFDELRFLRDVETALNWYYNSGRYPLAMRYLTREGNAFRVYAALARKLRAGGVFDAERGERARAAALYEAAGEGAAFGAVLRHDLLRGGLRRELPEALRFTETDEQRAMLRSRFHPVRGQCVFVYDFDVLAYEKGGALAQKSVAVVYE